MASTNENMAEYSDLSINISSKISSQGNSIVQQLNMVIFKTIKTKQNVNGLAYYKQQSRHQTNYLYYIQSVMFIFANLIFG